MGSTPLGLPVRFVSVCGVLVNLLRAHGGLLLLSFERCWNPFLVFMFLTYGPRVGAISIESYVKCASSKGVKTPRYAKC